MQNNNNAVVDIYTDGSCDTQFRIGAWVAILLWGEEKHIISGIENETTHNRMELLAVIKAIQFVNTHVVATALICIYSDSQYVIELPNRKTRLEAANYLSKKGTPIQNHLLVKVLFDAMSAKQVQFEKVKAHEKKSDIINYNIEADYLARKTVRDKVKGLML